MRAFIFLLLIYGCANAQEVPNDIPQASSYKASITKMLIQPTGNTVQERVLPPPVFKRVTYEQGSFAHYLQHFPVQAHDSKVRLYNGEMKYNQNVHVAILDIDIGIRDLQQCADAIMRLRAEYLWHQKAYDTIQFHFTNGFLAKFAIWRQGNRIRVQGNRVDWVQSSSSNTSYASFKKYLTMVFAYAGTLSLEKELHPQSIAAIEVGDVFIHGGNPGHAVLVIDKAIHPITGEQVVCLAQSYMPAQSIHVLKNPNNAALSPWYSMKDIGTELLAHWHIHKSIVGR